MWKGRRETLPLGTTSLTLNWKISPQTGISQQQPAGRDVGKQDPEPCLPSQLCREKFLQGKRMAGLSQGTGRGLQHTWSWEHSRDVGKEGGTTCCLLWHGAKGAPNKITRQHIPDKQNKALFLCNAPLENRIYLRGMSRA